MWAIIVFLLLVTVTLALLLIASENRAKYLARRNSELQHIVDSLEPLRQKEAINQTLIPARYPKPEPEPEPTRKAKKTGKGKK